MNLVTLHGPKKWLKGKIYTDSLAMASDQAGGAPVSGCRKIGKLRKEHEERPMTVAQSMKLLKSRADANHRA